MCVFLCSSLIVLVNAQPSEVMWNQTYGSAKEDIAYTVVQTSDGGFALAGHTTAFDWNGDLMLVKTDSFGKIEWNHTYGGADWDRASSLVAISDGGYVIAGSTYSYSEGFGDAWLIKTDADGNLEWTKIYGGSDVERANAVVETSDGGYALVGYTNSFGAGQYDYWLIKTDEHGNMEWNQTYGGIDKEISWALIETSDGGYALAGDTISFGAGDHDFWLVKTDVFGNMEWNKTYGQADYDYTYSLVEAYDGGYALAGISRTDVSADFLLLKTDKNGVWEWTRTYEGGYHAGAYSLIKTADGGYALAGYSHYLVGAEGTEFFLVKTDNQGNLEWRQAYGGTDTDHAYAVVETFDGGFALAGYTKSFGAGAEDFYLIKTDQYGNIPEFPSWVILPLLMVAPLIVIIFKKKIFSSIQD